MFIIPLSTEVRNMALPEKPLFTCQWKLLETDSKSINYFNKEDSKKKENFLPKHILLCIHQLSSALGLQSLLELEEHLPPALSHHLQLIDLFLVLIFSCSSNALRNIWFSLAITTPTLCKVGWKVFLSKKQSKQNDPCQFYSLYILKE